MAIRLTEAHSLTKKLRLLEKFMDENNVEVEWDGYRMIFKDTGTGESAQYRDGESGEPCTCVPHVFDSKLGREE